MSGRAVIERERRAFDDFFKIDEFLVSHEQIDGTMSAGQRRLVFERGDAVAVLLLNVDMKSVVAVEQFRVAVFVGRRRDDRSTTDGWIIETVAGAIDANETPEAAAIRETFEETRYQIREPRLISKFFTSPGAYPSACSCILPRPPIRTGSEKAAASTTKTSRSCSSRRRAVRSACSWVN